MMTLFSLVWNSAVTAWSPTNGAAMKRMSLTQLQAKPAGTFFNQVPEDNNDDDDDDSPADNDDSFESKAAELLRQRKAPSLASQPSTINGKPTAGVGFGKKIKPPGDSKPFIGIGPPANDPTKPEYDDQGFTVYTDERTGKKSRVFEGKCRLKFS